MPKINYTLGKDSWSITNCPHADGVLLRVGSVCCQRCKYHFYQNHKEHFVDCLCPSDSMLDEFPKNM